MQSKITIPLDFLIEAIWSPCFSEKRNRHRLTITIELQATDPYCIHHRRIMHNFDLDSQFLCSDNEISVSCSSMTQEIGILTYGISIENGNVAKVRLFFSVNSNVNCSPEQNIKSQPIECKTKFNSTSTPLKPKAIISN